MIDRVEKKPEHWLVPLAQEERLPGADELEIDPNTAPADAWHTVCITCGVPEEVLAEYVAARFQLPLADTEISDLDALNALPESLARRYFTLPIRRKGNRLVVATSDPADLEAQQILEFVTGYLLELEVAPPSVLQDAIDARYAPGHLVESLLDQVDVSASDGIQIVHDHSPEELTLGDAEAAPVVRLTNYLLHDAVVRRASDIHLEPSRSGGTVRLRVDGVLLHSLEMQLPVLNRMVSRLKVLGDLDIADHRRPQDGRARIVVDRRHYDLRIATMPTRHAEKATIRILDPRAFQGIADLHLGQRDQDQLRDLMGYRAGLVIVTGPTGSGKTTTLYARLRELADGKTNIMTVEDPVEYDLPGITQIQIRPKSGVTFASALRALLRHDPDIIFVGEIRDPETAAAAIQAGLTGHLVLSTMHTNDAVSVAARLVDLGIDRSSVADAFQGSLSQRLVRRVCAKCAEVVDDLREDEKALAAMYHETAVVRAVGCDACQLTGYRGRMPVVEMFAVTPSIKQLIYAGAPTDDLQKEAIRDGMRPMLGHALERVHAGETTLTEIHRLLGASYTNLNGRLVTPLSTSARVTGLHRQGGVPAPGFEMQRAASQNREGDKRLLHDLMDRANPTDLL